MAYGLHQLLLATVCGLSLASSPNLRASINVTEAFERNFTMGNASARHLWAPPPKKNGYRYLATTTRYGTNPFTACGLDSGALVKGTDYLAVASAQAMQDGCCRCNRNGGGGSTASLGCGSCGKGRFIRQLPRGFHIWTPESSPIFHEEYKFVVVDICPHSDNSMWCPRSAEQTNTFGVHNHLDFATVPKNFDNFYFEFTPEPCDQEMKSRLARMSDCNL
ncbi:unnamed protein product [Durusdinium trenchii]|uniref:Expansin-like EG45 domain-containing protein n=1 Tax=Durusdinium trenchii TaxID=1381693 RepID=A0ABP0HET0_9DINO